MKPLSPMWSDSLSAMFSASLLKSWLLPVLAIIIGACTGGGSELLSRWAFLASMVFMGLPHGGCDPLLPYWLAKKRGEYAVVIGIYLTLVVVVAALWWLSSGVAISLFLGITAWHWGSTDARWLGIQHRKLWGLGRGLFIVGASIGWQPALASAFLRTLSESTPFVEILVEWCFWIGFVGLGIEYVALGLSKQRLWMPAIIESAGLICLFSLVHPLLAITAYYSGIHAFRSMEIILPWLPSWSRKRPLLGFHLIAAPGALVVLLLLPIFGILLPSSTQGYERWAAAYFVLLSVLTSPHAILFSMLPPARLSTL